MSKDSINKPTLAVRLLLYILPLAVIQFFMLFLYIYSLDGMAFYENITPLRGVFSITLKTVIIACSITGIIAYFERKQQKRV